MDLTDALKKLSKIRDGYRTVLRERKELESYYKFVCKQRREDEEAWNNAWPTNIPLAMEKAQRLEICKAKLEGAKEALKYLNISIEE